MALRPFQKGVSGNPSGLPRAYKEMARLARSHSTEAIERLVELMRDKRNKGISLKACEIILDRAWGKAPQAIAGEAGEGPVKLQYEVSWKHADDGAVTIDLEPKKEMVLIGHDEGSEEEDSNRLFAETTIFELPQSDPTIRDIGLSQASGKDGRESE